MFDFAHIGAGQTVEIPANHVEDVRKSPYYKAGLLSEDGPVTPVRAAMPHEPGPPHPSQMTEADAIRAVSTATDVDALREALRGETRTDVALAMQKRIADLAMGK